MKQFDYTPILGWSVSRYDQFKTCKRKYYYTYYNRYSTDQKTIERLKKLTSIPLSIGILVHKTINDILLRLLKSEAEIDKERLFEYIKKMVEQYLHENTFEEVYYNKLDDVSFENIFESVVNHNYYFMDSERFSFIKRKALPEKQRWIIEPPGYGEAQIEGLKAYFKVDFLFPIQNKIFIIDWKTGKPNPKKHKKQLLGYACWAAFHFDIPANEINPVIVYLNEDLKEFPMNVTLGLVNDFASLINRETQEMYDLCQDITQNIPKPIEVFPKTESIALCNYCNFKELCFKE
jgi:CRISPR/Cas system-associated exonuclease Cas4 (RecB family)